MDGLLVSIFLSDNALDERRTLDRSGAEFIATAQKLRRLLCFLHAGGVYRAEAFALFDMVAKLLCQHDADRKIDRALLGGAAAAEMHAHKADFFGVDMADIARLGARHFKLYLRVGQHRRLIYCVRVAALSLNKICQLLQRLAAADGLHKLRARLVVILGKACGDEHAAAERQAQLKQVALCFTGEDGDGLLDLDGVADRAAERLIHVGDDRGGLASGHVADAGEVAGAPAPRSS